MVLCGVSRRPELVHLLTADCWPVNSMASRILYRSAFLTYVCVCDVCRNFNRSISKTIKIIESRHSRHRRHQSRQSRVLRCPLEKLKWIATGKDWPGRWRWRWRSMFFFRLVVICISDSLSAETGQLPYAAYTFTLGPIEWPSWQHRAGFPSPKGYNSGTRVRINWRWVNVWLAATVESGPQRESGGKSWAGVSLARTC